MSETSLPGPRRGRRADIAGGVLVALLVVAVFGQVVRFGWVFDDDVYVTVNPAVQAGLTVEGVRWAFTSSHAEFWHPVVWLSLMLDRELFGPGPAGFHATALLLHLANSVLFFLLLRRMTGSRGAALLAAALFAVHPLRAESVAWVSDRKDLLAALFCILTLLAYRAYAARPKTRRFAAVALLFALGLMAKPSLVTLPLAMLVLDWWPLNRFQEAQRRRAALRRAAALALEKVPLLLLALAGAAVAYWAQASRGGVADVVPVPYRLANAGISAVRYLADAIWPSRLAAFYPHRGVLTSLPGGLAAGLALAGVTGLLLRLRSRPHLLAGWLWYLLMLVPVIGLVQVGNHSHADRYTYLPHLWLLAGVTVEGELLARGSRARGRALVAGAVLAVLCLGLLAHRQAASWSDSVSLYRRALAVTSRNWFAHLNLGITYLHGGDYAAAEEQFREVLALRPRNPAAGEENLALALGGLGRTAEAVAHARVAARLDPKNPRVRHNLAFLLASAGDLEGATREWMAARDLDPDLADARVNLAIALTELGRTREAIAELSEVLRRDPGHERARSLLAGLLRNSR